ncbi:MAG: cation:dicarboxylase symporter family transporter, partial [Victivallaceae bacterium]
MKKISAPGKILLGMIIGVIIGIIMEHFPVEGGMFRFTANTADVLGAIFLNAFQMIVGPVVFISLVLGVMNMNNPVILGRVGLKTIAMYFITTILAIGCGLLVAWLLTPGAGVDLSRVAGGVKYQVPALERVNSFADVLINIVPKNIIRAFAENVMLQIIFVAILCGIALAMLGDEIKQLKQLVEEFNRLNIKIIDLIMKFAPVGVCALMISTFARFGYEALLPLVMYIVCVALAMLLLVVAAYAPMLKFYVNISPWHFLKKF